MLIGRQLLSEPSQHNTQVQAAGLGQSMYSGHQQPIVINTPDSNVSSSSSSSKLGLGCSHWALVSTHT